MNQGYFSEILREYDTLRMKNQQIIERRNREIETTIPAYRKLRASFASETTREALRALQGDSTQDGSVRDGSSPEYIRRIHALSEKKAALLKEHGYPADYLSPIYDCPDCHDTGFTSEGRCHCLKQRIADAIYNGSGMKDILKVENFQHFSYDYYSDGEIDAATSLTPLDNIRKVVALCKKYVEEFDDHDDNLLFYGNTGVGKTFLSHCIAKELMDSYHTVIYLTALELYDILEKHKFGRDDEDTVSSTQIRHILECDLLIIDDLGTELTNSFTISQLYYFMEERHLHHKSVIISTNLSFDELRERYSERIFSRITNYKFLKIYGDDIRVQKAFE